LIAALGNYLIVDTLEGELTDHLGYGATMRRDVRAELPQRAPVEDGA
jgi:hypothetical protein